MKIKLAAIPAVAMLVCPYLTTVAQSCSTTAGANSASNFSTAVNPGSTFNWSNPGNAQTSDNSYATAGIALGILSSAQSNYLVIQNFGFSIPATATICKIIVDVERSASGLGIGGSVTDGSVRLLQNGILYGNDLAATTTAWPSSDGVAIYGNALLASTWGGSWQPSDVNNPNFGVAIATQLNTGLVSLTMQGKIDQVKVTVIYDPNSILGITLGKFSVTPAPSGEAHLLSWTAAAMTGGNFIIQRSVNSRDWQDIATVPVTTTASHSIQTAEPALTAYSYTDDSPLDGANYYRLHLVSLDGKSTYSTISEVIKEDHPSIRCWPNPCMNTINIFSPQPFSSVVLKDLQGRTLYMQQTPTPVNHWRLPAESLPPGLYFVQVGSQILRVLKKGN